VKRLAVPLLIASVGVASAGGIALGALKSASATVTVSDHAPASATAKCKPGTKVVSGGFDAPGFDLSAIGPYVQALASRRTAKKKWTVDAYNAGDSGGESVTLAYCANSLPKLKARSRTRTIGELEADTVRAKCPKGGEAVSGGFIAGEGASDPIYPYMSRRNGDRTWTVRAFNGGNANELTAIAYCAKRQLGLRREVGETFFTEPEAISSATARCDKGFKAISGGFVGVTDAGFFETYPFRSRRSGGRTWTGAAATYVDGMDAGARWEVYAYCLKKEKL
jgi:hypothetical protein